MNPNVPKNERVSFGMRWEYVRWFVQTGAAKKGVDLNGILIVPEHEPNVIAERIKRGKEIKM